MASNLTATIISPLIMGRISFAMLIFSVKYRRLAQRNLTTGGFSGFLHYQPNPLG